ncbi:hypothetical protein GCM10010423_65130 [Streptomyces levis]|uniref:Uncharacterized protein n=1 Tax=Streptomyces levis TaxID=285566 RepID=A0ABP6BBQ1_9ACTN
MSNTARKKVQSPRRAQRGAGGKFVSTKSSKNRAVPVEEVDELQGSAVSVEEEPEEDVETVETDEDLNAEEAEEYEDEEEDEEEEEEDEDEDYDEDEDEEEEDEEDQPELSSEAKEAIAAEMDKSPEPEPVKFKRLTIMDIQRAQDITEEEHYVEEWEGTVLLRSPSARKIINMIKDSGQGSMRIENGQASTDEVDFDVMLEELVKMSVVDPVIDEEAYQMILDKSAGALFSIFGKVREIAKLDRISGGKKVDAVKEEEKRFRKG